MRCANNPSTPFYRTLSIMQGRFLGLFFFFLTFGLSNLNAMPGRARSQNRVKPSAFSKTKILHSHPKHFDLVSISFQTSQKTRAARTRKQRHRMCLSFACTFYTAFQVFGFFENDSHSPISLIYYRFPRSRYRMCFNVFALPPLAEHEP